MIKRMWTALPITWPLGQSRSRDDEGVGAAVNGLAWPVIIENLLQTLLGVVDLIFVGALGAAAVAGVGAALQVLWVIQSAFSALTTGTTVLVAHAIGAKEPGEANRVLKQSLLIGAVLSLLVGIIGAIWAEPILALLGGEPEVVADGVAYFRIGAITGVFMLAMFIMGAAMRGAGDSKTPMMINALANVINVILAWALIFGHLGMPALGVAGSAWAAGIARGIAAAIMLAVLLRGHGRLSLDWRPPWAPDMGLLKRTLHIGIPSMIEMVLMSAGMLVYGVFAIHLGTDVYAAQRITLNAISFAFMPGLGYAIAATTLTGQALGAKRPERAKASTSYAMYSALALMTFVAMIMFFFGRQVMRIFTPDEQLILIGAEALKVVALAQPFQAVGQVLAGSLRGAGDTRFPMWVTAGSIWFIRLPLAYLFGPVMGMSLAVIYISNIADAFVRMTLMLWRYSQGKWQTMKV